MTLKNARVALGVLLTALVGTPAAFAHGPVVTKWR